MTIAGFSLAPSVSVAGLAGDVPARGMIGGVFLEKEPGE